MMDPIEQLIEDALVEAVPERLKLAIEDGVKRGCLISEILAVARRQRAGPLLTRGMEIVAVRAMARPGVTRY